MGSDDEYDGIPTTLIVRNVPHALYSSDEMKQELIDHIAVYAKPKNVIYLPSFRRVRFDFNSSQEAFNVRTRLSILKFHGEILNVFFIQPDAKDQNNNLNVSKKRDFGRGLEEPKKSTSVTSDFSQNTASGSASGSTSGHPLHQGIALEEEEYSEDEDDEAQYQVKSPAILDPRYLHPPKQKRNFLISPPCSPPEGWEQVRETKPKPGIEVEILSKLSELKPGMTHTLIASNETIGTPSICVHVCDDMENSSLEKDKLGFRKKKIGKIIQTKRPPLS